MLCCLKKYGRDVALRQAALSSQVSTIIRHVRPFWWHRKSYLSSVSSSVGYPVGIVLRIHETELQEEFHFIHSFSYLPVQKTVLDFFVREADLIEFILFVVILDGQIAGLIGIFRPRISRSEKTAINSYSLQIGTWATCRNCQQPTKEKPKVEKQEF